MPFDFKKFDAKCANMAPDELQREWEHYTRLISGSATSTAVSGAAIPFTLGVSVIGVGLAAPAIHNARKKREIIERHLNRHGTTHVTRKRDVLTPMAISGTVGLVTLGVGSVGADAVTNAAAEHGFSSIAANEIAVKAGVHLAVDGVALAGEEHHMKQKRLAEAHNAWLKQQALAGQSEKGGAAPAINSYNPGTYGQDVKIAPQYTPNAGPITTLPMVSSPPPLSSAPSYASTDGYFPSPQQQYSEKSSLPPYSAPSFGENQGYPPQPNYSEKPVYYDASKFTSGLAQPPPPPPPATPAPPTYEPTQYRNEPEHRNSQILPNNNMPGVGGPGLQAQPETATSPVNQMQDPQSPQHGQATYPMPFAQQTSQPMYPSYPGTMVSNPALQQTDGLDHAMHRLSIASPPPPPPAVQSSGTAQRHNSLSPTSQFNSAPQPHHYQPSENTTSYFPPASGQSPMSPPPATHYASPPVQSPMSPPPATHYASAPTQSPMSPPPATHYTSAPTQSPMSPPPATHYASPPVQSPMSPPPTTHYTSPPVPSPMSPPPATHYASPPAQPSVPYNPQPQVQGNATFNPYPTPAQTPGPGFNQYPAPSQTPGAFNQPPGSAQLPGSAVNPYPAPSQTPGPPYNTYSAPAPPQTPGVAFNGYPTPAQTPRSPPDHSVGMFHSSSYPQQPQSNSYFPPPPGTGMPGGHQQPANMQTQYGVGAYGYPTPVATPSQKSEGGMYFPPPPTTPFNGRR